MSFKKHVVFNESPTAERGQHNSRRGLPDPHACLNSSKCPKRQNARTLHTARRSDRAIVRVRRALTLHVCRPGILDTACTPHRDEIRQPRRLVDRDRDVVRGVVNLGYPQL